MQVRDQVCPLCGANQHREHLRVPGHRLLRCTGCSLVYLDLALETGGAASDDHAARANQAKYSDDEYNDWYLTQEKVLKARFDLDLDEIERVVLPGRLLDVGCAHGFFLEVAANRGWKAFGVEVSAETSQVARSRGLEVHTGTLADCPYSRASFDLVTFWDVVEHVDDPVQLLSEALEMLRPGGILAMQSPNIDSASFESARAGWEWLLLPQHRVHFSPATYAELMRRAGFEVVRVSTWEPFEKYLHHSGSFRRWPRLAGPRLRRISFPLAAARLRRLAQSGRAGLVTGMGRRP